jgi:hypothetical protein
MLGSWSKIRRTAVPDETPTLRDGETLADAYVMFSPGNFQDASIDAIDPSGVPWL